MIWKGMWIERLVVIRLLLKDKGKVEGEGECNEIENEEKRRE